MGGDKYISRINPLKPGCTNLCHSTRQLPTSSKADERLEYVDPVQEDLFRHHAFKFQMLKNYLMLYHIYQRQSIGSCK